MNNFIEGLCLLETYGLTSITSTDYAEVYIKVNNPCVNLVNQMEELGWVYSTYSHCFNYDLDLLLENKND